MKKLLFVLTILVASVQLEAQKEINDPNAQVRNVKGFHAIRVSSAIDLYLSQSNEEVVVVSAASTKYRDRIRTTVENGVLKIWYDEEGWKWNTGNKKMKAYVSFVTLDKLVASGACDVRVTGTIKAESLDITISGASDFRGAVDVNSLKIDQSGASDADITGNASNLEVEVSGASDMKGYDLKTETCRARASGASDIRVTVNKELNAHASGASGIYYKGDAVIREIKSNGASSVSKRS
jgi:Putative auto-transporter adhesin, head GIN domain